MKQNNMIKEIAERAGVSTTTVSNVIHGRRGKVSAITYDKIEQMINEYDYQINIRASLLAGRKSILIAVLDFRTMEENCVCEWRYMQIRRIIEAIYMNGQYALIHFPRSLEEGISYIKIWSVDKIIVLGLSESEEKIICESCSCKIVYSEKKSD